MLCEKLFRLFSRISQVYPISFSFSTKERIIEHIELDIKLMAIVVKKMSTKMINLSTLPRELLKIPT